MEPVNQRTLVLFLKQFRKKFSDRKTVWCYTGYTYETDLLNGNGKAHCEATDDMLSMIDVLVDGEFIQEQYDISLRFRGSRNQRLIDLRKSEQCKKAVLWTDEKVFSSHEWG